MSRITDYILEPKVVYTDGGFLVRVKVIDDYKYKKYIVSENLHYKTIQGTSFTLTDASSTKQASITEIKGNTTQEGTPTPSNPVEVQNVTGDNNVVVSNKNLLKTVNYSGTKNGCPVALSSDNTFSSNGTTTGTQVLLGIDLIGGAIANYGLYVNANATKIKLQAGSYTLSITNVQGTLENVGENFFLVAKYREGQSTGLAIKQTNFASMPMTFTLAEETEVFIAYQVQYTKANNYSFNFMLEKGNQATTYIQHEGNSYRVDLGGKNILNLNATQTKSGVTCTNNGDGSITLNGTATANMDLWIANGTSANVIVKSMPNGTALTQRINVKSGSYTGTAYLETVTYNGSTNNYTNLRGDITYTFTYNGWIKPTEIYITNGSVFNNWTIQPQLEKRKSSNSI